MSTIFEVVSNIYFGPSEPNNNIGDVNEIPHKRKRQYDKSDGETMLRVRQNFEDERETKKRINMYQVEEGRAAAIIISR